MCFIFYFSIFFLFASTSRGDKFQEKLSNLEWVCANKNCSVPISLAKPKQAYNADHKLKVSFRGREIVNILGKPTDEKENIWLVSVGEKFGVVSKELLRETDVLVPPLNCTTTKYDFSIFNTSTEEIIGSKPDIKPSPAIEVVDGTTLSHDLNESDDGITVADEDADSEAVDYIKSGGNDLYSVDEQSTLYTSSENELPPNHSVPSDKLPNPDNTSATERGDSEATAQSFSGFDANASKLLEEKKTLNNLPKEDSLAERSSQLHEEPLNIDTTKSSSTQEHTIDAKKQTDEIDSVADVEKDVHNSENNSSLYSSQATFENMIGVDSDDDPLKETQKSMSHQALDNHSGITEAVLKNNSEASMGSNSKVALENNSHAVLKNNSLPALENNLQGQSENKYPQVQSENNPQVQPENNPQVQPENNPQVQSETNPLVQSENYPQVQSENNPQVQSENNPVVQSENKSQPMLLSDDFQKSEEKFNINNETYNQNSEESSVESLSTIPETSQKESPQSVELLAFNEKLNKQSLDSAPPQHVLGLDKPLSSDLSASKQSFLANPNIEILSEKPPLLSHDRQQEKDVLLEDKEKQAVPEIPKDKVSVSEPKLEIENLNDNEFIKVGTKENSIPSHDNLEESPTNWFSPVSSAMNSIFDMFVKSDIGVDDQKTVQEFTTERIIDVHSFHNDKQSEFGDLHKACEKDNFCDRNQESLKGNDEKDNEDFTSHSIPGLGSQNVSPSTLVCLIVTSIAILLFSLGYYYLENLRQDTELAARINSLSAELFFAQKELATAEEQLAKTNENFQRLVSNTSSNEEALVQMKQELEENEDMKQKLEQEIKRLEKEIESLVESSNEMHRMLAESISEDERTQALLANIDDLKSVVSSKLDEISSLTNQLDKEKQEVELLTIALKKSEEKKESLEEKLEKIINEIDSKAMAVTKEFEEKIISLERIIEENSLERANFEREIYELKQHGEALSFEKELAEKTLKKAQGLGPGKALADWLETKEIRVEIMAKQKEVEKLKTELQESKDAISNLQEREKELLLQIESLNNNYETAEKNKIEALTKLQVLSNYFKEKETQLQEELGEKEAQWLQKQSEDHTIYEQMRSLREENLSYKAQNEALKREILDQETSFKIQVANEEQKAQEHWIQLRHTERRLKEAQMEAAHLRSRLTAHEMNPDSIEDKHNKSLDLVNGEVGLGAASPPFMLYPPPDFIPPPPLISPSRPPPLGRLSSPPLTPPPPLSPYDIFPPPPASPPPPLRVHKPQPREPSQKQKDSQSSNHSSESTEKPLRRGKR